MRETGSRKEEGIGDAHVTSRAADSGHQLHPPCPRNLRCGFLGPGKSGVRLDLGADHVSPRDAVCGLVIWAQTLEGGRTGFAGPAAS